MPLAPGSVLHRRYRILEILGQGGMGAVYHAVDEVLQIEVAIKENLFASPEYSEQFRQEARLLASLRHPNLPRVTDYFVIEGQGQYLIMDFIPGEDLKQRIEREGPLPIPEALTIAIALCEALEYLHGQHPPIVHRDIKPGNVRLTPQGEVYLVDFGLAKIGGADQRTVTGAQAVTPGFSSPEQYGTGTHTGPRSDLYGLAATLYMALTGTAPEDAFERLMDTMTLTPLRERRPEVPAGLAEVIEAGLALRPKERLPSATVFKERLLALGLIPDQEERLRDHQWRVTPAAQRASGPRWKGKGAFSPPPAEATAPQAAPPGGQQALPGPGSRRRPGRPARRWLLLLLALVALLGALALPPERWDDLRPLAAPDTWRQWLSEVGLLTPVPPTATPRPPTAQPHPASLLPVSASTATLLPATETPTPAPTPSATLPPTATPLQAQNLPTLQPTPWGQSGQLAFASNRGGLTQIWLYDLSAQTLTQLTHEPDGACQPAWHPSGLLLAYITPCTGNQIQYEAAHILVLDLTTGEAHPLVPPSRSDFDPAWSPDGSQLAFTSLRDGHPQIYLLQPGSGELVNLSANAYHDFMPAWSPDGDQLALISTRQGTYRVYRMGAQGTPQIGFSRSGNKRNLHPIWSPDGINLVFSQTPPEGIPRLIVAPLQEDGWMEIPLTPPKPVAMADPNFSPDGRWIAFEGWGSPPSHDIYIISANGQTLIQITHDRALDFDPAWRPPSP